MTIELTGTKVGTMAAKEKIGRAFDRIYDEYPFLASIVASWKVSRIEWGTAATDGPSMYYNPAFIDELNIAETTDLVLHEAGHVFLGHHIRFKESADRDPQEWNIGADEALNDTIMKQYHHDGKIRQHGLFPGEGVFAHHPKGKDAEFYYDLVHKERPKQPQNGQGGQGKGQSDQQPGQGSQRGQQPSQGQQPGSGDGNGPQPIKKNRADLPDTIGDVLPHPSSGQGEEAQLEAQREWEQQVARGINDAKSCGNLPGWLKTLAEGLYAKKSKVDWKMMLRRFLTQYAPNKYTYSRPNRRASYRKDIILPARHSREAAPGCVLVDTSGSMSDAECNLALNEIQNIMTAYERCEVTLKQADTRLIEEGTKVYTRWDFPITKPAEWHGRGGTDLSPAFKQIGTERKFKWLVIISDMEWNYTGAPNPGIPTMWVVTSRGMQICERQAPHFGMVVGPVELPEKND